MAVPTQDPELLAWSTNFMAKISAAPAVYSLTSAQAGAYGPLHQAFADAYNEVVNNKASGVRSESITSTKDTAKAALVGYARQLYGIIQSNDEVTDANKILAGIHVRTGGPTPVPVPSARPGVKIVSVVDRTATALIFSTDGEDVRRRKPEGVRNAFVYTFVGATYPADPAMWQFYGVYGKSKVEIEFPNTLAAGTQVWVCAAWANAKGEAGPPCLPVTTNLQGGGSVSTTEMKIAA